MKALGIKAIFDNEGETLDRYTVILNDGDMLGLNTAQAVTDGSDTTLSVSSGS